MRTTHDRAAIVVRLLALACAVALTGLLGRPGPLPVAAEENGVVDEGCAVPELYPNDGLPCVPPDNEPVPGSDEPICYAPVGDLDCGPDTIGGGDCQDPAGCSVPGDPGSGGGCDPAVSDCGTVIEVPPPVDDTGGGDDEAPPCPPEWTVEGGCVIPIGTLPGEEDSGGGSPPCPDGGKSCAVPEPAPIVGVEVSGEAINEGVVDSGESGAAETGLPGDAAPAPASICASSCEVTSGLPADAQAPGDTTMDAPGLSQTGFGVALGRLDMVQGRVASVPGAFVFETVLIWLWSLLLP